MMPGPKRTKMHMEVDRSEMVRLMRRGWTKQMMSERFGVTIQQVHSDYKVVMGRLGSEVPVEERKMMVSAKLEELAEVKREAWAAWSESWKEHKRRMVERGLRSAAPKGVNQESLRELFPAARMKRIKEVDNYEPGCPGVQYLRIIVECIRAEREMMGLDALKTVRVEGTMSWDMLVQGAPDGPVPDVVEEEIRKLLDAPHEKGGDWPEKGEHGGSVNGFKDLGNGMVDGNNGES